MTVKKTKSVKWTPGEVDTLKKLIKGSLSYAEMQAQHFPARSVTSVASKAKILNAGKGSTRRAKPWSPEDLIKLEDAAHDGAPYAVIQKHHFPARSVRAVATMARKLFEDEESQRKGADWTTLGLRKLAEVLESYEFSCWDDVAAHLTLMCEPTRTGNACRQAATKYLPPPEQGRSHIRSDEYLIRKYGPPPTWATPMAKIIRGAFEASGKSRAQVAYESGVSAPTFGNILHARRVPLMVHYVRICQCLGIDAGETLTASLRAHKGGW